MSSDVTLAVGARPRYVEVLAERGVISPLDQHFAETLRGLTGADEETLLCAALASRAIQLGHVCVELERVPEILRGDGGAEDAVQWPSSAALLRALDESPLCVRSEREGAPSATAPLVLDAHGRLYLQRYAHYERELAANIRARAHLLGDVDLELLGRGLRRLFGAPPGAGGASARGAMQRLAACVATLHPLAIICGGPGTGKTTTVVKILALLQEQALERGRPPLGMLLLAPTGKAARRLAESVTRGVATLDVSDAVKAVLPSEASTIHRALGGSRRAAGRFRHDAENPLPFDLVLVDEVSMVDLALLYRLLRAVRPQARLILQGDKDQLASVEAGAILGDIYDARAARRWSSAFAEQVRALTGEELEASAEATPLGDCLVSLEESFRYAADSSIGRLARAINRGDASAATRELTRPSSAEPERCVLVEPSSSPRASASDADRLADSALAGYGPFIAAADPREKLARLGEYRILCSHRQGPRGVLGVNRDVEGWLAAAGLLRPETAFYENRPIIITQNDYALGLFNGDVGVIVLDGEQRLRACFDGESGLRLLAPGRLPPHETVFATTIHKSQGSEFDVVSVVLPERPSALVGRELVYTAVTRARRRVEIFASADVLQAALGRSVQRASGLHDALWRP